MTHDEKNPLFSERVREQLLTRRILVLDGPLDDDNGTLLATQLLTLAAEDPGTDVALWMPGTRPVSTGDTRHNPFGRKISGIVGLSELRGRSGGYGGRAAGGRVTYYGPVTRPGGAGCAAAHTGSARAGVDNR